MLTENDLRERSTAQRVVGRGGLGGRGYGRLEQVVAGSRMSRGRGKDQPQRGPGELGIRLASTATRSVIMVLRCGVMVEMPVLHSLLVEGDLLDGGMYSA